MTALIVDDEPLARALLVQLLAPLGVRVVGECEDGMTALQLAMTLQPNLVFLDIRMPGVSGIEAASRFATMEPAPLVVLVSGYSEHALEAFERSAFDYILKPASSERLELTIRRAVRHFRLTRLAPRHANLRDAQRLPVKEKGAYRILQTGAILYAAAFDKAVTIKSRTGEFRCQYTLSQLEQMLPSSFMRIHASFIVNISAVETLLLHGNHSYSVRMIGGEELPVGRQHYANLQRRLGFPDP